MNRTWWIAGLAALGGFLLAFAWRGTAPPAGEPTPAVAVSPPRAASQPLPAAVQTIPTAAAEIDALRRRIDDEADARRELEGEVEALRRQLAGLQARAESSAQSGRQADSLAEADDAGRAWFDERALLAAGMDEARARELKLVFEQLELERLRLRDRAVREGWDRERRRTEFEALAEREVALRERLGEDEYAAYLYAAGQPNSVEITSVLASAPAAQAGIRAGDRILRYANERIYSPRELSAATRGGAFGEPVEIEVERDGENLRFYLSRGPMGVRTGSLSLAP